MIPRWLDRLWAASTGRFGIIVVAVIAVTALVSLLWTPFDPQASDIGDRWLPPSWPHLLGTDDTGRDILSLLMAGHARRCSSAWAPASWPPWWASPSPRSER